MVMSHELICTFCLTKDLSGRGLSRESPKYSIQRRNHNLLVQPYYESYLLYAARLDEGFLSIPVSGRRVRYAWEGFINGQGIPSEIAIYPPRLTLASGEQLDLSMELLL